MYQIAINDPKIFLAGEAFARENHSSLSELVNKYVANSCCKVLEAERKKSCLHRN